MVGERGKKGWWGRGRAVNTDVEGEVAGTSTMMLQLLLVRGSDSTASLLSKPDSSVILPTPSQAM